MVNTLMCFLTLARNIPYDLRSRLPQAATEVAYFNTIPLDGFITLAYPLYIVGLPFSDELPPGMAGLDFEGPYLLRQIDSFPHNVNQGRAVVIRQISDFNPAKLLIGGQPFDR